MSRNQSINHIAPYVATSSMEVKAVRKVNASPFSPYFIDAKEQYNNNSGDKQKHSETQKKQPGSSVSDDLPYPEIFTLIANPDFSDFFALSLDKDGSQLMYIVKKVREKRGVTTLLPISKARQPGRKETNSYLHTCAHFTLDKVERFTTKM